MKLDYQLLRKQKQYLLESLDSECFPRNQEMLEGIINLIDQLQDSAKNNCDVIFEQAAKIEEDESKEEI